ncbi:MAG TPA: phenylalanine--tRNA ligase subunit beta [Chitinophagaceae bacterium]|jgi:phenylalanyl-tRNA synthetase beta chain|nr:phenylalanine--tRNA ligase subunit beta [Chitinophagaceae bacterium]
MKVSYKWLNEYIPSIPDPERLSRILTSIGLEVEDFYKFEEVKGGLEGLVVGEVLSCEKHPNADKLTLTTVNINAVNPLQIVCGAPNVAVGQKVVVARPGTTIYPISGESLTMKVAKIRGIESQGMICAEDEIGLGESHEGIMVLADDAKPGTPAAEYFQLYGDWIYEIGLTPNRMDAMSHWGVARDVCAYLSHHDKTNFRPKIPNSNAFKVDNNSLPVKVAVENTDACQRYSGISIANISITESPLWIQQRLKAIGVRPINNIVDVTNYIQHETGQPLHSFDADELKGKEIVVKNLPEGTEFITLDEKKRKLSSEDLMICDAKEGVCIAGVFGGLHSGVTDKTKNIFLESAWFNPIDIRKTSFRHGLRTDAASRFEKGIDISNTVNVLRRAAMMIKEICGGEIASEIVDVYPQPKQKIQVALKYHYLKKLSGKNYHSDTVKEILGGLGFDIIKDGLDELVVAAPLHKPDISLPADVVEEIVRIDGLDNIEIPASITMTPSVEENYASEVLREKVSNYLVGLGFNEIMTNSITNEAYFDEIELQESVKMLNSLSAELNIMRPSMLETGLEAIAHNLNRKNNDLKFFDFGKTYNKHDSGKYYETEHLCIYVTGNVQEESWRNKTAKADFYFLKGIITSLLKLLGVQVDSFEPFTHKKLSKAAQIRINGSIMIQLGSVANPLLNQFDIKQPIFFADINWSALYVQAEDNVIAIEEIPRFPVVYRDLATIVSSELKYEEAERAIKKLKLNNLQEMKLFDVFESEKLGTGKKSMAISFTFLDKEKTLTDKEIDEMMSKIMTALEKEVNAEIRK